MVGFHPHNSVPLYATDTRDATAPIAARYARHPPDAHPGL